MSLPVAELFGFTLQGCTVVPVFLDQLSNLGDRKAKLACELTNLVFLVAADLSAILVASVIPVVCHHLKQPPQRHRFSERA